MHERGQVHAPAFIHEEIPLVPIENEYDWTSEGLWKIRLKSKTSRSADTAIKLTEISSLIM
jgi:hypothetical protein